MAGHVVRQHQDRRLTLAHEVTAHCVDEVSAVAELWQAGKHDEARNSVPVDLGRLTNLLGTQDVIADRVSRYRAAGITTLLAKLEGDHDQQLATLQRLVAIAEAA